ncbi:MAG TPA: hypothetical protein DIU15_12355, partial [Deltaproteobacteria bacterium]|nr:hypothetical protein [Deltaproteobacteria bacterium]
MSIYALVIEDDQDAGELMVQMLQSFGLEVDLIDHPHDALFAISTRLPDLLVLDLCLPGMAGPTLLDSIHGMGSKDLPIVAVSAVYPKDHAITQAALAKGAAIFIGKPFTREVMRIAAQKALGCLLPDKAPATPSPPRPAPAPRPQAEDYASHQHMNGAASTEVDVVSEELKDGES